MQVSIETCLYKVCTGVCLCHTCNRSRARHITTTHKEVKRMGQQKLDDNRVEQLLRAGKTQLEVVAIYRAEGVDVTQSAISQAISSGRIKVNTDRNSGGIPWKLRPEHRH